MELTILMPCLNEAPAVADCVREAATYLKSRNIPGEISVVDNGSNDHSRELAAAAGGRVIIIPERGYGNAIRGGILAAKGKYIIIGDCDGSYDFSGLDPILEKLRQGSKIVSSNSASFLPFS